MPTPKKSRRSRTKDAGHAPMDQAQLDAAAELFAVLSEPSRLRILQVLQAGPESVGELGEKLSMKQANVSKQLGILQAAGVVSRRQEGNRAIYGIALPMVFDLCKLVCRGIAELAAQRAKALQGAIARR